MANVRGSGELSWAVAEALTESSALTARSGQPASSCSPPATGNGDAGVHWPVHGPISTHTAQNPLWARAKDLMDTQKQELAVPKHVKVRETNKKAQARYRERQKRQTESFKVTVSELTEQVRALQEENARLQQQQTASIAKPSPPPCPSTNVAPSCQDPVQSAFVSVLKDLWFRLMPEEAGKLSEESFQKMPIACFLRLWKNLTVEMAQMLADGAADPGTPANARLLALMLVWRESIVKIVALQPHLLLRIEELIDRYNGGGGGSTLPVNKEFIDLLSMNFEQKVALVSAFHVAKVVVQRLREERQVIINELQATLPISEETLDSASGGGLAKVFDALARLKKNADMEELAVLQFHIGFRCEILSPIQEAIACVYSFPKPWDTANIYQFIKDDIHMSQVNSY